METLEKALLGTFLKENHFLKDTTLKPTHLEDIRHKQLFSEMLDFSKNNMSIDIVTLSTSPNLEKFGGISYLNEILSYANVDKIEEYENLVFEAWKEREKKNILSKASLENWDITKIMSSLDEINESKVDDHVTISEAIMAIAESPWQEKQQKKGISTGIRKLDVMTNGFVDGEMTVIAARPSVGKTDVMLHFAKQAGWHNCMPIVFSLEMPYKALTDRLVASTGGFNRLKMRDPYKELTPAQKEKWPNVLHRANETAIHIFDRSGQTIPEIRAKVRKLVSQYSNKKPIVFVDYLTLIPASHHYNGNMHQQTTEVSNGLKAIAKEFDCPVVVLAQLNRSVESRQNKRPQLSDIRESGSVEQIADVVIFLYREKYYDQTTDDSTLELIIAKNRQGPIGTVITRYNEHTGEIADENSEIAI